MSDAAGLVVLAGRILFAFFFGYVAAWGAHIKMGSMMEGYAKQMNFPLAAIAGWPTGLWLIVGSLSIALGVWPDVGSLMIIAFLLPALTYFVVSTSRSNGTIQSSVVNAGVLDHPLHGRPVVAFVAAGSSRRLVNLRAFPRATVVIRTGWQWPAPRDASSWPGPTTP